MAPWKVEADRCHGRLPAVPAGCQPVIRNILECRAIKAPAQATFPKAGRINQNPGSGRGSPAQCGLQMRLRQIETSGRTKTHDGKDISPLCQKIHLRQRPVHFPAEPPPEKSLLHCAISSPAGMPFPSC